MEREAMNTKVVKKLLRKNVVGKHNKTVDTVKNWFPTHLQDDAKDVIKEMVRDPEAPVERYGGARNAIRLTSVEDAKRYIEDLGFDPP
ncbi:MAG: hypothetical protein MAG715_00876 [Methanonatronarchaeales archaeon]|nr:hypothetical protein [Methanonatronarchaeales archaeon]